MKNSLKYLPRLDMRSFSPIHIVNWTTKEEEQCKKIQQPDGNEGFTILWNSEKQQHYLEAMNRILQNNDVSEEKWVKEASVFNRNLRQQLSVEDKEKPKEAVNPDFQRKSPLCRAMLLFLQENILIAAITMTAIFVMIVLVLLFSAYTKRKQALYSPTNMN
ncbi:uncharacterized protein C2orf92-like isoform X2 [Castor canadensis]|uniref:Uncharacterized protein C2orf92-like isoform X2 n=1 Tax=Castor canadensis TaxID=51338 RepID=A0AC58KMY6_CASCN